MSDLKFSSSSLKKQKEMGKINFIIHLFNSIIQNIVILTCHDYKNC